MKSLTLSFTVKHLLLAVTYYPTHSLRITHANEKVKAHSKITHWDQPVTAHLDKLTQKPSLWDKVFKIPGHRDSAFEETKCVESDSISAPAIDQQCQCGDKLCPDGLWCLKSTDSENLEKCSPHSKQNDCLLNDVVPLTANCRCAKTEWEGHDGGVKHDCVAGKICKCAKKTGGVCEEEERTCESPSAPKQNCVISDTEQLGADCQCGGKNCPAKDRHWCYKQNDEREQPSPRCHVLPKCIGTDLFPQRGVCNCGGSGGGDSGENDLVVQCGGASEHGKFCACFQPEGLVEAGSSVCNAAELKAGRQIETCVAQRPAKPGIWNFLPSVVICLQRCPFSIGIACISSCWQSHMGSLT